MGVGNFFGMLPDSMADSRLYGVELDSITGRIAKKLYPQADITVAGFETTDRRDFYDLAVGNVPFGQYKVNDKAYGSDIYQEALKIIAEAWWGDSDSFLSGILHGVTRFVAMYRDEYSRERLIARLSTVHPKTITKNARKDTGNTADRHMKQILEIYNGSSRSLSLPVKR